MHNHEAPLPPPIRYSPPVDDTSTMKPPADVFQIRTLNLKDEDISSLTPHIYNRPIHTVSGTEVPAKPTSEANRQLEDFSRLQRDSKRSQRREAKRLQQQRKFRAKLEAEKAKNLKIWSSQIIPHLPSIITTRKAKKLFSKGIPSCYRKHIWPLVVGNPLGITKSLFNALIEKHHRKANSDHSFVANEMSMKLIDTDIPRTFPTLSFFSEGPWRTSLYNCLVAFVEYRPDIGYVQGMSFIQSVLLLFLEPHSAFTCFSNIIVNNPILSCFYTFNQSRIDIYYKLFDHFLLQYLPNIATYFKQIDLHCSLYLHDWFNTVFSRSLSLDCVARIWDNWFLLGDVTLMRTSLAILSLIKVELVLDFEHALKAIKNVNEIEEHELFSAFEIIDITPDMYSSVLGKFSN
ncbi:hypothetical protein P9112_007670 [Eukaryota sp. TZLM1-RC]